MDIKDDNKIKDCRYCDNAGAVSPEDVSVMCYLDIGEYIPDPSEEAKTCPFFLYNDTFPKF